MDYQKTREVLAAFEREGVTYVNFGAVRGALHRAGAPGTGAESGLVLGQFELQLEQIKGATYQTMKGLGHFPMSEDPERFYGYIEPVLGEIVGGRVGEDAAVEDAPSFATRRRGKFRAIQGDGPRTTRLRGSS